MNGWIGAALLLFFVCCACGMVVTARLRDREAARITGWAGTVCSLLLMTAAVLRLIASQDFLFALWTLHGWGTLSIRLDPLSAIFLFTAGLVYLSCSLFTPDYIRQSLSTDLPGSRYGVLYFALMATVALVLIADDALIFLLAWECMSILCYLLVNYDPARQSDSNAGFVMLAISEAGFLAVVIAFLIAASYATSFSFADLRAAAGGITVAAAWGIFMLGFLGFGVKAGLVPVNFWLPRSYTACPPVFIPVLAGVTLNLGLYGIIRLNGDLIPGHGVGMGVFALIVGSITAVVGILYATTENDLKSMLAHSSIENAGIIVAGFGAFLVFRDSGKAVPAAIALTASLYHMANHSVYKALLYQGTSHIEAVTGTRDMDSLGGLIRILPALSCVFLVGCLAIAAVPPFNGFVSEWLTLQSLLRSALISSAGLRIVFALCGAVLALTAALAVTCFVKTYAMTFLGIRRGVWVNKSVAARSSPVSVIILAVACFLLGVLPTYIIPVLNRAVEPLAGTSATASLLPPFFTATESNQQLPVAFLRDFRNLGARTGSSVLPGRGLVILLRGTEQNPVVFAMSPTYSVIALALLLLVAWFVVGRATRRRELARREVWAGGIPRLLPEMTYTATGFSNPVRVVFQAIFRPNIVEDTRQSVGVHFRTAIHRRRDETYLVERIFLRPIGDVIGWIARGLAGMHHGKLNAYAGYFVTFLLLVLILFRLT